MKTVCKVLHHKGQPVSSEGLRSALDRIVALDAPDLDELTGIITEYAGDGADTDSIEIGVHFWFKGAVDQLLDAIADELGEPAVSAVPAKPAAQAELPLPF
jgi:hypothetical protein